MSLKNVQKYCRPYVSFLFASLGKYLEEITRERIKIIESHLFLSFLRFLFFFRLADRRTSSPSAAWRSPREEDLVICPSLTGVLALSALSLSRLLGLVNGFNSAGVEGLWDSRDLECRNKCVPSSGMSDSSWRDESADTDDDKVCDDCRVS